MDLINYHKQLFIEISVIKERIASLISRHKLSLGQIIEFAIKKVLEEKIPERYGLSRGLLLLIIGNHMKLTSLSMTNLTLACSR